MEPAVGQASDHAVEHARLDPVEPTVHPGRAARHRHVGACLEGVQQSAHSLGLHLEVCRQREDHVAPTALDAQAEGRGLTEGAGEGEQPHRLALPAQRHQLGRRREPAIEHEQELMLLAAPVQLLGEAAVQRGEVVGALDDGDDHRNQPDIGGGRALDSRFHEGALGGHDQRTSQAVGISRALSRSLLSATSATSPSMAR
jgi:hypothetical protein